VGRIGVVSTVRALVRSTGDTFLRRPGSAAAVVADVVRAVAAVSVVAATIGWGPVEFAVFMLSLLGALVPRALGIGAPLDIATGVTCVVAAWSNVFGLYTTVLGWDKVVHFALTAVVAALVVVVTRRSGFLPPVTGHRLGHATVATLLGLGLGALWEMGEWAGHTFIDTGIFVHYVDTIGDLGADGLGALMAGLALPWLILDEEASLVISGRTGRAPRRSSAGRRRTGSRSAGS
jgi:hypothetical protein